MSARMEEKQIAKEIINEMLRANAFVRSEYPNTKTVTEMICQAYKEILKTISQDQI